MYNLPENIQARKEEKRRQDEDWRRARLSREQREHEERVQKEMEKQRGQSHLPLSLPSRISY